MGDTNGAGSFGEETDDTNTWSALETEGDMGDAQAMGDLVGELTKPPEAGRLRLSA